VQSLEAEPLQAGGEMERTAPPRSRVVLPRFLRKPARMLSRADFKAPRHAGLKGAAFLFLSTAAAGVFIGGHGMTIVSALTAWSGLAIDSVEITGQSETSEVDVLAGLGIGPFPSIVTFDVETARASVEALPWIKEATIRKLYPDTLQVSVVERRPFAIWQHDGKFSLIDETGKVIVDQVGERYAKLPVVVGPGAADRAREFVDMIDGVPSLKPLVKAGVLVAGRRWNVVLDLGIEIMLPEKDPGSALVQVVALDDGHKILSRRITTIDLRLPSRLVVRLDEEGLKARQAMLKEREKHLRKMGAKT